LQDLFDRSEQSRHRKLVSDAVINLYAAHVHSLLYPYKHPLISDALKNAFHSIQKAFRTNLPLHLETVEGRLMLDGEVLAGDTLVIGNFTAWLNSRNIKALSFVRELTRRELIAFHNIISTKELSVEQLSHAMAEKSIVNISVNPVRSLSGNAGVLPPEEKAPEGFIKGYENTMYYMQSGQAQAPFFTRPVGADPHEDAASYGLVRGNESRIHQQETPQDLSPFSMESGGKGSMKEMAEGARYAECVEALLERDVSEDIYSVIREIPPVEMAHLLNTMLFRAPGEEVIDRVISAYFGGGGGTAESAAERCRIFLTGLKSDLRRPFLSRYNSLFGAGAPLASQERDLLPEMVQGISVPSGKREDAELHPEQPAFVPCRTLKGSDFSFDFIACGNAVLHDIEIPGETALLFDEAHMAQFHNGGTLDALLSSARTAAGDSEFQAAIIAECTEEAITGACFDVVLSLLGSSSLDDDSYRSLEGRLISLVEVFSEKGEFGKVLDIFNSLKTQSLQGKWRDHASAMTRRIFSSEKVISAIVGALRRYGRKQRDIASKLTSALRSFIIPYLLDALSEEEDTSIRRFLISLLTEVRSDAADHIARRLRDSSWYVVRNMLYLLRECRGRSHSRAVRDFLEHEVPLVRLEALRTLLSFQDPEADACLVKFLRSNVSQLQKGAVRLSGAYRTKYAVPYLQRMLQEQEVPGKRSTLKKGIVRALGRIGDSRSIGHLLRLCRSTSGLHKDEFDKLKVEIFKTLHNYPATTIGPLIDFGMKSGNKEIVAISKKLAKPSVPQAGKQG